MSYLSRIVLLFLCAALAFSQSRTLGESKKEQTIVPRFTTGEKSVEPRSFVYVLSKIAPLEFWQETGSQPGHQAPSFCWRFFRPNPQVFQRLESALSSYQGDIKWHLVEDENTCIKATSFKVTSEPTRSTEGPAGTQFLAGSSNDDRFVSKAISDIPRLCRHIETFLKLESVEPQQFNPDFLKLQNYGPDAKLEDFYEPGAHTTVMVSDPERYSETQRFTSDRDRILNFGITPAEINLLYFEVLNVNKNDYAEWKKSKARTFGEPPSDPEFPLLSRINDPTMDISFEAKEVPSLRAEALRLFARTSNRTALRGLDKLIKMTAWAMDMRVGIYLLAP